MRSRTRSRTTLPIVWSDAMAYVVGLTATDGCLLSQKPGISFTSKDRDLIETYLSLLGRSNAISRSTSGTGALVYRTTFADTELYAWFERIGLTPRKSLTLGTIDVPEAYLRPLVLGLLDGDGSISNAIWKADTSRRTDYYYEWLRVRFCSGSLAHIDWLVGRLRKSLALRGWITQDKRRNSFYTLAFGKHDSIRLLTWLYSDAATPSLQRKRAIWNDYARRHADVADAAASHFAPTDWDAAADGAS
jgi:hypothetical protein